ncbi:EF-hand calcium-binding domain [Pycnococcus provasolii]
MSAHFSSSTSTRANARALHELASIDDEVSAVHTFVDAFRTMAAATAPEWDAVAWEAGAYEQMEAAALDAEARSLLVSEEGSAEVAKTLKLDAKRRVFSVLQAGLAEVLESAGLHDASVMTRALQAVNQSLFDQYDGLLDDHHALRANTTTDADAPPKPQKQPLPHRTEAAKSLSTTTTTTTTKTATTKTKTAAETTRKLRSVVVEQPRLHRIPPTSLGSRYMRDDLDDLDDDDFGDDDEHRPYRRKPQGSNKVKGSVAGRGESLPAGEPRDLTLRQTREIILAVCAAKLRANRRAAHAQTSQETMAHFLITWLNHRFGLRSLVRRWAVTIVSNVRAYAAADFAVACFQHMVRNEVDEGVYRDLRRLHRQLVSTFAIILRRLGESARNSHNSDEDSLLDDLRGGRSTLADDASLVSARRQIRLNECEEVLRSLLDEADANRVSAALATRMKTSQVARIPFEQFVQATLSDFLTRRRQYLAPVSEAFRRVDSTGRGMIDEAGFRAFLSTMHADYGVDLTADATDSNTKSGDSGGNGGDEADDNNGNNAALSSSSSNKARAIEKLLMVVDPHSSGCVTFSQSASLFLAPHGQN